MVKKITIFTTSSCASCVTVKRWLGSKGHSYEEVDLDRNPERRVEAIAVSGAATVPITIVTKHDNSQEVVIGCNISKLAPALH
jgi:glutaredoxin